MRYDEFRDNLHKALHNSGLYSGHIGHPAETIDIGNSDRRWELYVIPSASQNIEPFYLSSKISFDWRAANAARASTCEEDLLTEILGTRTRRTKTQNR